MYTHRIHYTKQFVEGLLKGVQLDVSLNTVADAYALHAEPLAKAAKSGKVISCCLTSSKFVVRAGSVRIETIGKGVSYA